MTERTEEGRCPRRTYLRRLRVVGVMEAVGEEEDRESVEEAELMAIREEEEAPSDEDMSRLISSLLRRDTVGGQQIVMETKELTSGPDSVAPPPPLT